MGVKVCKASPRMLLVKIRQPFGNETLIAYYTQFLQPLVGDLYLTGNQRKTESLYKIDFRQKTISLSHSNLLIKYRNILLQLD
jgi:hypothetical protein